MLTNVVTNKTPYHTSPIRVKLVAISSLKMLIPKEAKRCAAIGCKYPPSCIPTMLSSTLIFLLLRSHVHLQSSSQLESYGSQTDRPVAGPFSGALSMLH